MDDNSSSRGSTVRKRLRYPMNLRQQWEEDWGQDYFRDLNYRKVKDRSNGYKDRRVDGTSDLHRPPGMDWSS